MRRAPGNPPQSHHSPHSFRAVEKWLTARDMLRIGIQEMRDHLELLKQRGIEGIGA